MSTTKRALLFDLDGTLLDLNAAEEAAARTMLAATSELSALDPATFLRAWRSNRIVGGLDGSVPLVQLRRSRMAKTLSALGIQSSAGLVEALVDGLATEVTRVVRAFPDVDILAELARHRLLAVVTNGDLVHQRAKLVSAGLGEHFSIVIASIAVRAAKPDPTPFFAAARSLGVPPSCCVHVGDLLIDDVGGARAAGMTGVLVDRRGRHTGVAALVIRSLRELPGLLDRIYTGTIDGSK